MLVEIPAAAPRGNRTDDVVADDAVLNIDQVNRATALVAAATVMEPVPSQHLCVSAVVPIFTVRR